MRISTILLCLSLAFGAFAQDVKTVSKAAYDAYQAKDWAAYLTSEQKLDALRPNHPRVLYNLAGAYALNGKKDLALETLSRVATMGLVYPAARDEDFASVREDERFAMILETFAANEKQIGNATTAFTLETVKGSIPEGVARDQKSGTMWVSLVRDRTILQVEPDGSTKRLPIPEDVWSVTGLQYDASAETLWFCTASTPMMRRRSEQDEGRSAIVAWSVKASKVLGRWDLDNSDAPHWLGDLILAPDGSVYATDSRTPAIYRIRRGEKSIEEWVTNEGFVSLQGLALDPGRNRLFVADYAKGIWSVDLETGGATMMPGTSDATVLGIDGLYWHEGSLVAIQNGTNPHRVIRIRLDSSGSRIEHVETLEANRPQFDEPTLGVVQDDTLWFVATSQWGSFADDGTLKEGAEEKAVLVMKRTL